MKSDDGNSLVVSSTQNPGHFPYRDARLTVENATAHPIAAVRLRWCGGGPAVQFPLAIPPGGRGERAVFLPALSVSQTYDIELLPADEFTAQPVARMCADIQWPAKLLTKDAFLDPTIWETSDVSSPPWSGAVKTSALFVGTLVVLVLGAVLLFRRGVVRFRVWTAGIACLLVVVFVWLYGFSGDVLQKVKLPNGYRIQTRRTGEYSFPDLVPPNFPVYTYQSEIRQETLIAHPERGAYLTLRPNETRVFLKLKPGKAEGNKNPSGSENQRK
ncbi:MAG: hypothetical protein JW849_05305 [Phycisphaerae bacterium]|nr:hypothetical protein [Phycisphaerae bacterium]